MNAAKTARGSIFLIIVLSLLALITISPSNLIAQSNKSPGIPGISPGNFTVASNPINTINTAQLDWPYIRIGDFNADGKSDIVTYDAGRFWTYFSLGNGAYQVVGNPIYTAQLDWPYIWIGDFNADGKSDIVTYEAGWFWTYLSWGNGTYQVVGNPINTAQLDWPYIWIGDFNADDKSDIVTYDAGRFWTYFSL